MRAIVFDLDGTLLQLTRSYRELLATAFEETCGRAPAAWIDDYEAVFSANFSQLRPDPVRRTLEGVDVPDPEEVASELLAREIAAAEPAPGAIEALDALGDSVRLGVLTNGVRSWQLAKLRAHDLEEYFDAVVASYEAGAHKPAPAPFRLLERRLPADAYAMVGDDPTDIEGATGVGWDAIEYDGDGFAELPEPLGHSDDGAT